MPSAKEKMNQDERLKSAARESSCEEDTQDLKRMDEALKAALKMPPRKHKDEPKRQKKYLRQKKNDASS